MKTRTMILEGDHAERYVLMNMIRWQITHFARLHTGHFVLWSEHPQEAQQPTGEAESYAWLVPVIPTDTYELIEEVRGDLPFAVRFALAT